MKENFLAELRRRRELLEAAEAGDAAAILRCCAIAGIYKSEDVEEHLALMRKMEETLMNDEIDIVRKGKGYKVIRKRQR